MDRFWWNMETVKVERIVWKPLKWWHNDDIFHLQFCVNLALLGFAISDIVYALIIINNIYLLPSYMYIHRNIHPQGIHMSLFENDWFFHLRKNVKYFVLESWYGISTVYRLWHDVIGIWVVCLALKGDNKVSDFIEVISLDEELGPFALQCLQGYVPFFLIVTHMTTMYLNYLINQGFTFVYQLRRARWDIGEEGT